MSAIKYDNIHLYAQFGHLDSANFRKHLTGKNIAYTELTYRPEAVNEALMPLSTWFDDGEGGKVQFADMPILIYDTVLWESQDKTERYAKRTFAKTAKDLPKDFTSKATKNV